MDYEKLGAFYLGKTVTPEGASTDDLLLYDSKDLTTHALCVGMTGSGKTGLCVGLLEEAAIDGIPALVIDPKGDLGNLLLTFPDLSSSSFQPWIDPAEATRKGLTIEAAATKTAELWKSGLAQWGQDGERIAKLKAAADFTIYTPGSRSGVPLRVLRSFNAPTADLTSDDEAFRERIQTTVTGLLALLGIDADPIRSREHILLSNILDRAWRSGRNLDLAGLIREIQSPPFDRIGVLDLESIFPEKDRFELTMSLNNLLASPGFSVWMEGEPLDIGALLYTPEGKPRVSILSIAHLADSERMFFVTLLLNELIAWMRQQPGTSSLRALLYMDEIFGYFPPSKNPPSKAPMLTLLKQARAFGVGVVLSTQNPVDLDYKGLSNCGTWFLGRLQTERDKMRVLDGLEGASASNGQSFDRASMDRLLSGLGKRVFLMNNVHDDGPALFQTRWVLSYLRGPLTRKQIQTLMASRKVAPVTTGMIGTTGTGTGAGALTGTARTPGAAPATTPGAAIQEPESPPATPRPILPDGIQERFVPWIGPAPDPGTLVYRPGLLAHARLHYVRASYSLDTWIERTIWASIDEDSVDDPWGEAERIAPDLELEGEPDPGGSFADLPVAAERKTTHKKWKKGLKLELYRGELLPVFRCKSLKQTSTPGESEGQFRARLSLAAREARDLAVEKLRAKYEKKIASLESKILRAQQKVEREQGQLKQQTFQTAISLGATVLGALFGKKKLSSRNVGRATTAARGAGRVSREKADIGRAVESLEVLQAQREELELELAQAATELTETYETDQLEVLTQELPPRKSDIEIESVVIVWTPWKVENGRFEPAFSVDRIE